MAAKDFGPIESDYAFFMAHATEAESDVAEYAQKLSGFAGGRASIGLLDFGCGTGDFSLQLASALNWPPETLRLTLVEPVTHQREQAAHRLTQFTRHAIVTLECLPLTDRKCFDLILSNHVLYYVDDLGGTLRRMSDLLLPGGKILLAIAGWENVLLQLWKTGFAVLERPVPYHAAEDVEACLVSRGVDFRKTRSFYQLRFPDAPENRLRILRFLFGDYLPLITPERLLGEFDRHVCDGQIVIDTHSDHFELAAAPT